MLSDDVSVPILVCSNKPVECFHLCMILKREISPFRKIPRELSYFFKSTTSTHYDAVIEKSPAISMKEETRYALPFVLSVKRL